MPRTPGPSQHDPMSAMNMTPLIDVLLVLLIMFIITVPIANNVIAIDLPQKPTRLTLPINPIKNKLSITAQDQLLWNARAVSREELAELLATAAAMPEEPELQFEPAALASYDASAKTLQMVKTAGLTKFGFVGNDKYREFALGSPET